MKSTKYTLLRLASSPIYCSKIVIHFNLLADMCGSPNSEDSVIDKFYFCMMKTTAILFNIISIGNTVMDMELKITYFQTLTEHLLK